MKQIKQPLTAKAVAAMKLQKEFDKQADIFEDFVLKHIGQGNYAGDSSIAQIDRVRDKFHDCALQDLPGCKFCDESDMKLNRDGTGTCLDKDCPGVEIPWTDA